MGTLSCLAAPPCTPGSLTVCKSRSLLPQKGNTLSGSEDLSWLHSQPSNRCGSPSRSTMNLVPQLSTESASKATILILPTVAILSIPPPSTTQHFTLLNSNLITNHSNKLAFFG